MGDNWWDAVPDCSQQVFGTTVASSGQLLAGNSPQPKGFEHGVPTNL